MNPISSYDNTNDSADYRHRLENDLRANYDEAKSKAKNVGFELRTIEEDIIDAMADIDDARHTIAFMVDKTKELSVLFEAIYRAKSELQSLGLEP